MARTQGSKNKATLLKIKKPTSAQRIAQLEAQAQRAGEVCEQARDQINDLMADNEFYRKQINHLLALVNILARGN
jgi:hypothetical protein